MKLSNLKNGAVVELRNGNRFVKIDNTFVGLDRFGAFMGIDDYNENMENVISQKNPKKFTPTNENDIVKVNNNVESDDGYIYQSLFEVYRKGKWTWEREKDIHFKNI